MAIAKGPEVPHLDELVSCWPSDRVALGLLVCRRLYWALAADPAARDGCVCEDPQPALLRARRGMHGGPTYAAKVIARFSRPVALVARGTPWILQALRSAVDYRCGALALQLHTLEAPSCWLQDEGADRLAEVLQKCAPNCLRGLNLHENGLGARGVCAIVGALAWHSESLQDLDLRSLHRAVLSRPPFSVLLLSLPSSFPPRPPSPLSSFSL